MYTMRYSILTELGIHSNTCVCMYSYIQRAEVCVSVAGGSVRVGASGLDYSGAGKETHAAALQVLG